MPKPPDAPANPPAGPPPDPATIDPTVPPGPADPARVTGRDVDRAAAFWKRFCAPEFKGLITAENEEKS